MKFLCDIRRLPGGAWSVRHSGPDVGSVETQDRSREAALEKMRGELRYRLELCPCTGESYQHIAIELAER